MLASKKPTLSKTLKTGWGHIHEHNNRNLRNCISTITDRCECEIYQNIITYFKLKWWFKNFSKTLINKIELYSESEHNWMVEPSQTWLFRIISTLIIFIFGSFHLNIFTDTRDRRFKFLASRKCTNFLFCDLPNWKNRKIVHDGNLQ